MKAVILCGGLGTRFMPFSKAVPKEMYPIVDTPALTLIAAEAALSGYTDIAVVINPHKKIISDFFSPSNAGIMGSGIVQKLKSGTVDALSHARFSFIIQEQSLGTAHAAMLARAFTAGDPFALLNGDDLMYSDIPVVAQLDRAHARCCGSVVGVQKRQIPEILNCGVIDIREDFGGGLFRISRIAEKPDAESLPSDKCSLGRYLLTNDIFDAIERIPRVGGEYRLTDAIDILAAEKAVYAYEFSGRRFDLGNPAGALEANNFYMAINGRKE
ncbi:MAG: sugar phosphate nucleotidyltransferase [Firmicutes bacterium]|nr:sugar phosphate nucleotidyltransferase [Bacillota bacterium]